MVDLQGHVKPAGESSGPCACSSGQCLESQRSSSSARAVLHIPAEHGHAGQRGSERWFEAGCTGARVQVVLEMVELREVETARSMLRTMRIFQKLQRDAADRFLRLDRCASSCALLLPCLLYTSPSPRD